MSLVAFDHYMERRVMRDLQRVVNTARTLTSINNDLERKEQKQKLISSKL